MNCRLCQQPLQYVHGHGTCLNNPCLEYGKNQAECCTGETAQYFSDLVVENAESVMTGGPELAMPAPMFELEPDEQAADPAVLTTKRDK